MGLGLGRVVSRVGSGSGAGHWEGVGGWSEWVGQRQCPWWRGLGQVDGSDTPI